MGDLRTHLVGTEESSGLPLRVKLRQEEK
jgi:hypothetical protein